MSKNKKILMMLTKGGASQSDIASALHVSKRDVSAAAKVVKEHGLAFDAVATMDADMVDSLFFPKEEREPNGAYLRQDMAPLVERKKRNRKLPVKLFWMEYCERAESEGKLAFSYQMFARLFADEAEKLGATRHFTHEPGGKCYIDWAGDAAYLTDKLTGARTKVHVLVVTLPFSDKFWAEGFCDMKQKSWQDGQIHAFEAFGGVPRMWVPDNAATATSCTSSRRATPEPARKAAPAATAAPALSKGKQAVCSGCAAPAPPQAVPAARANCPAATIPSKPVQAGGGRGAFVRKIAGSDVSAWHSPPISSAPIFPCAA